VRVCSEGGGMGERQRARERERRKTYASIAEISVGTFGLLLDYNERQRVHVCDTGGGG